MMLFHCAYLRAQYYKSYIVTGLSVLIEVMIDTSGAHLYAYISDLPN